MVELPNYHILKGGGGPMTELLQALAELVIQAWSIFMIIVKVTWTIIVMTVQNPLLLTFAIFSFIGSRLKKHR